MKRRFAGAAFGARSMAVAGATFGLAGAPAWADVTALYNESGPTYTYTVTHIPDFDQKRAVLPSIGNMYCVPTSAVNWCVYFAHHGAPWVAPGPADWEDQSMVPEGTAIIADMGFAMGTDEINGTNGYVAQAALSSWLGPQFVVVAEYPNQWWTPDFHSCSMPVFWGAYVNVVVGWYSFLKFEPDLIERVGGHSLSLAYGARSGDDMEIGWRDPASDEGVLFTQSPWATEEYPILPLVKTPTNIPGANPRVMSKVFGYGSAYIDEMLAIYPMFALTSQPGEISFDAVAALSLWGSTGPGGSFTSARGTRILDLQLHADLSSFVYIAESLDQGPREIWRHEPVSRVATLIDVPMAQPKHLQVGRRRGLYVVDGFAQVACVDIDRPEPVEVVRVTAPGSVDAIAVNDQTDEVHLLSVANRSIMTYPWNLVGPVQVQMLPGIVPLGGSASIAVGPDPQIIWIMSDADDAIHRVRDLGGGFMYLGKIAHPQLVDPEAFDVSDAGDVFVSAGGQVLQFHEGDDGVWALAEEPLFPGMPGGAFLRLAGSSTNYDATIHGGPEWNNVLPEEFGAPILDCAADLDASGVVGFNDLLIMLAAWGPCPPGAFCAPDLDFDGAVGFADLLVLLSAWGPCP
jgi:hypothetical protein